MKLKIPLGCIPDSSGIQPRATNRIKLTVFLRLIYLYKFYASSLNLPHYFILQQARPFLATRLRYQHPRYQDQPQLRNLLLDEGHHLLNFLPLNVINRVAGMQQFRKSTSLQFSIKEGRPSNRFTSFFGKSSEMVSLDDTIFLNFPVLNQKMITLPPWSR